VARAKLSALLARQNVLNNLYSRLREAYSQYQVGRIVMTDLMFTETLKKISDMGPEKDLKNQIDIAARELQQLIR
jgi:hypothetical protein